MAGSLLSLDVLVCALVVAAVAGTGARLTRLDAWYRGLRKPSWQPPDWLFGPAWTLILTLCAAALVLAWRAAPPSLVVALFGANFLLNIGWSLLFFRLRRPDWALIEVAPLWLSILAPMLAFARADARIAWLLLPYLLWVSFAAVLNRRIVTLNRPFG